MLNYIWFGLMAVSLVVAAFNGTAEAVTKATVDSASTAVDDRHRPRRRDDAVARDDEDRRGGRPGDHARAGAAAGAAMDVSRGARRAIPPPARSSSPSPRTCSGLNNAATPLGIKAMEELQELNGDKETATNPMVTFMAMTTSGVQLIPSTMIALLAAAGSTNPTAIIAPGLVATFIGTVAAVIAAKLLQPFYPARPAAPATESAE